jgi:uncharacterized protein (DUF2225 family)
VSENKDLNPKIVSILSCQYWALNSELRDMQLYRKKKKIQGKRNIESVARKMNK